jgi:NADH:ubiquinone oxidoreductase subunit 5 (subunit L)/multisubunit Na+/H+ antiporter MnhA subunit
VLHATALQSQLVLLAVVLPFAAVVPALTFARRGAGSLFLGAAVACFATCASLLPAAVDGEPARFAARWIPALGVELALRADAFGLLFALLISGIGALIAAYSIGYMRGPSPTRLAQYYAALLAFMGAMLGVALADDWVVLFVFWEITSVASFLLIGFWYEEEAARKGALTALLVTGLGGMVMLAGILAIGVTCQTFSISRLTGDETLRRALAESWAFAPALVMLLAGALTKSAQFPLHFWLPGAMVAPTPISTYLHAATMVKAGVFLLGRMLPVFAGAQLWSAILVPVVLATFLLGAFQAMRVTDLKAILARTTLATLGMLTFQYGLGQNGQDALQVFSHATYKGALFLVAGIVEHATHTRDIRRIGGLAPRMPITFAATLLAALSMGGIWPTLGYHAKEASYQALLDLDQAPALRWSLLAAAILGNALLVAVALTLVLRLFLGKPTAESEDAHEPSPLLWAPAALLAGIALTAGLFPTLTDRLLSSLSSRPDARLHLALLPHARELALTVLTTVAGIVLYASRKAVGRAAPFAFAAQRAWDALVDGLVGAGAAFAKRWQNGSVYWYFSATLAFTALLASYALWSHGITVRQVDVHLDEVTWYGVALCAMLAASAVMVAGFRTRLAAAIALSANGFFTALLFVVYRSPDILLTQILIEIVSTIFILLILYFMPPFRRDRTSAMRQVVNVGVSAAVGGVMFALVLLGTSPQFRETHNLALDYLTRAKADAGGANAVNVIIVDMRAMDTTGEITVLMMVGLVVFGLLRARRAPAPRTSGAHAPEGGEGPILHTVARFAVPLTAWMSVLLFLQGHDLPGGGFIAGVLAAAAGAMSMLAFGSSRAGRIAWWKLSVAGLAVSVATGIAPFVLGRSFMDHELLHLRLPFIGVYELPTATFFDLGVYMIVLGTIMTIFVELAAEESRWS